MIKGNVKLFLDRTKLTRMINLRIIGYTEQSLATMFGCDRVSISQQLIKYNIIPLEQTYDFERITRAILPSLQPQFNSQWEVRNGERINLGKSYKEYLTQGR